MVQVESEDEETTRLSRRFTPSALLRLMFPLEGSRRLRFLPVLPDPLNDDDGRVRGVEEDRQDGHSSTPSSSSDRRSSLNGSFADPKLVVLRWSDGHPELV